MAQELLRNVKDGADEKELIALAKNIVEKAVANKPVADKVEWTALAEKLLPNIFIYSLFFAAWKWSSTHFRAHWHDFTTNAYRHRALVKFGQLEKLDDEVHFGDIRRLSGMLLLLLSDSAYTEESNEITGTERIIKLEEMIRELFTTKQ